MKPVLIVALLALLAVPALAHTGEGGPPKKLLQKLFPKADAFVTRTIDWKAARASIERRLGAKLEDHDLEAPAYIATAKGQSVGVAWMTDAHLKGGEADVLVGLDLEGRIVGVALDHSPVPSLAQSSFLKQFQGMTAFDKVQAAPKQEEGSRLVAAAVKKGYYVLRAAVLKKEI